MKPSKRILAIRIITEVDQSPDTSYLGEYSNHPTSEYSIDRAHSNDCSSLSHNHRTSVDALERIIGHLDAIRISPEVADNPDNTEWGSLDEAQTVCIDLQSDCMNCDCTQQGRWSGREYRYFNPSSNYVGKQDKPTNGFTPEDVREYTRQDYKLMESLNNGQWCYIGIRADAEYVVGLTGPVQHITSGGLWGVESNSDKSYIKSVQQEKLAELKTELLALGFSKRAISTAYKSIEEKEG